MKHVFLALALLLGCTQLMQGKEKTVNRPPFKARNISALEINKIVLSDTATVFFIDAFYRPRNWIRIDEATYLQAGDTKIPIKYGDGIELSKEFWMPESGEASFKLIFPPLPKGTKTVDFIESDCEDCFKIWDIQVDGKALPRLTVDKNLTETAAEEAEKTPRIEQGVAILSGKVLEYKPSMQMKVTLYSRNIITKASGETEFTVNEDGTFHAEIPLVAPTQVYFSSSFLGTSLLLAPNKETRLFINLREIGRAESKLRKDEKPYGKKVYVQGAYTAINNDLINNPIRVSMYATSRQEYDKQMKVIHGMSPAQYKAYWMNRYREVIDTINAAPGRSENYKQICRLEAGLTYLMQLSEVKGALEAAYKKANNIDRSLPAPDFKMEAVPADYYSVLKELDLNNPQMLCTQTFLSAADLLLHLDLDNKEENPYGLFEYLLNSGKLKDNETAVLNEYLACAKSGKKFEKRDEMMQIRLAHDDLFQEYGKKQNDKSDNRQRIAGMLGTGQGLIFELMDIQPLAQSLNDFIPATEEQLAQAGALSPVYREILTEVNNKILQKIEENKKKTGYTLNEVPAVPNEALFDAIVSNYKGKVIFVDFWATWCSPCRMAMKEAEPVKAVLEGKGIVYLYLTGESSPAGTWKNMIPDIHGEHYRLNNDQWNYICSQFNVNGVPSYMVIDKNGRQVHFQTGFMGAAKMKEMLLEEAGKN